MFRFLVFFFVGGGLIRLLCRYVANRLATWYLLPLRPWLWATVFVVLFVSGMMVGRMTDATRAQWRTAVWQMFFGILLLVVVWRLLNHLLSLPFVAYVRTHTVTFRWRFGVSTIFLLGLATRSGLSITTTFVTITTPKVTKPFKIAFMSDLHVDMLRGQRYVQRIVDTIQKNKPDLVLVGGDRMSDPQLRFASAFAPLRQLMMPIYGVLGNHDGGHGETVAIADVFRTTTVRLLRQESVVFSGVCVIGIDDPTIFTKKQQKELVIIGTPKSQETAPIENQEGGSFLSDGSEIMSSLAQLATGPVSDLYTILLYHRPLALSKWQHLPIDLHLAGHTHRGQYFFLYPLIASFNDYVYGLYEGESTNKHEYVSQGVGTWGFPFRLGTRNEVVIIELRDKK